MHVLLASSDVVTSDATVVLAVVAGLALIFNAVLAFATFKLYGATQNMATQTAETVKAANREADASLQAVREMKNDRALRIRPILTFRHDPIQPQVPRIRDFHANIGNVGTGAAIMAHYASYSRYSINGPPTDAYGVSRAFAIGAGTRDDVGVVYDEQENAVPLLRGLVSFPMPVDTYIEVVVCQDTAENWYRFVRGEAAPEIVSREDGPPLWAPAATE